MIEHVSVAQFINDVRDVFVLEHALHWRVMQFSAITFDAFIWEIIVTFLHGGSLVIVGDGTDE